MIRIESGQELNEQQCTTLLRSVPIPIIRIVVRFGRMVVRSIEESLAKVALMRGEQNLLAIILLQTSFFFFLLTSPSSYIYQPLWYQETFITSEESEGKPQTIQRSSSQKSSFNHYNSIGKNQTVGVGTSHAIFRQRRQ